MAQVNAPASISPGNGAPPMPKAPYEKIQMQEVAAPTGSDIAAGLASAAANQYGIPTSPQDVKDVVGAVGSDFKGMAKGAASPKEMLKNTLLGPAAPLVNPVLNLPGEAAHYKEQKAAGKPAWYRALTPVAENATGLNVSGMEQSAEEGSPGGVLGHAAVPLIIAGAMKGAEGIPEAIAERVSPSVKANLVKNTYSGPGDYVASSLRSNARVDVPAEANNAHAALQEGLADRGFSAQDFKGRNGPKVLQAGLDNALRIHEARVQQVIDPIRNEPVPPDVLAENPELAQRLGDRKNVTYGDLDAERIKMNKELRRANYYAKDPTAQAAVGDPLANTEEAVRQARDVVYGHAQDVTGVDLRPLKSVESSLLKLTDIANTTANVLSAKGAQHASTPFREKALASAKSLIATKTNPLSALSAEKPGLTDPLSGFNRNMQKAFVGLKPSRANLTMELPGYKLNLTPPPGETPRPIFQRELLNQTQGQVGDVHNVPGAPPLDLTPSGNMPPDVQRVLGFEPGLRSQAYPGVVRGHVPQGEMPPVSGGSPSAIPDALAAVLEGAGQGGRGGLRLNPTPEQMAARPSAVPSPEYEYKPEGVKQDVGETVRKEQPPLPRGERRMRVRTADEEATNAAWKQARKELGDDAPSEAIEARVEELKAKPVAKNASGESDASLEALNAVRNDAAKGIKTVRIDTRSGQETPVYGVNTRDMKAGPYETIVRRSPDGTEEIIDQGAKARKR